MVHLNITKKIILYFDAFVWSLFGLLWIIFADKLLSLNTVSMNYDDVHIHMTRAFGLFLIYTGYISYNTVETNNLKGEYDNIFKIRLTFSILLLIIMIYDNFNSILWNEKHINFGMLGLSLSMIIPISGLLVK